MWEGPGRAPPTVGGAIPGPVALGSVRMQAVQAMGSKPVSSTPSWPLLQFLPNGLSVDCDRGYVSQKAVSPSTCFGPVFYRSSRKHNRTCMHLIKSVCLF